MKETPKAAQAFLQYCLLGHDRSLAKLAVTWKLPNGKLAANLRQLETWSAQHSWQLRVTEYDKDRIEKQRINQEDAIRLMNERHAIIGATQQERAIEQIEDLIAAKKFGSQAAVQLLKLATDLERLARMPEKAQAKQDEQQPVEPQHGLYIANYDYATQEELDTIQHIQDAINKRKEESEQGKIVPMRRTG